MSEKPHYSEWRVGDIVSRIGTDRQEILAIVPDMMLFRCTEPSHDGCFSIRDEECNVPWRYEFVRRGSESLPG